MRKILVCLAFAVSISAEPAKYTCDGFAEPLHRPGVMRVNRERVLPLRGKLVRSDGTFGDSTSLRTPPVVSLKLGEADLSDSLEVRDYGKGKSFVFDAEAHWKFDLGTGNLAKDGTYTVMLLSGDPAEYVVDPACRLEFALSDR